MNKDEPDFSLPPIEDVIEEIMRDKESKHFYENKYPSFSKRYPTLSNKIFEKDVDINIINYMIYQIKQMNQNKQSERNASIKVGTLLVDKFVKPNLSNL